MRPTLTVGNADTIRLTAACPFRQREPCYGVYGAELSVFKTAGFDRLPTPPFMILADSAS